MSSSGTGTNAPPTGTTTGEPTIQRQKRGRGALIAVVAVIVIIIIVLAVGYEAGWFKGSSSSSTGTSGCTLPSAGNSAPEDLPQSATQAAQATLERL